MMSSIKMATTPSKEDETVTAHRPTPPSHRPDDEEPQQKLPEVPDVPEGGIPDRPDAITQAPSDQSSSEIAEQEQQRQLETGEENPG